MIAGYAEYATTPRYYYADITPFSPHYGYFDYIYAIAGRYAAITL